MKILITGANGLLGQKLIEYYHKNPDVELIATGKGMNRNPIGNYIYIPMDVTSSHQVDSIIRRTMPEVIINTAAMTNVDQCEKEQEACWKLNVTAVEHLIKACAMNDCFFIHLSTDFVFDGKLGPYKEDDTPNPLSYYAKSKWTSEQLLAKSHITWAVVRTILVYGVTKEMSRPNIVLWAKKNLEKGKQLQMVNDQWRTPTLVEDLAIGCALVAKNKTQGVFHISGKNTLTPYQMAIKIADFFKLNTKLIKEVSSSTLSQPAIRPAKTGFHIEKARKQLGYEPVSFENGLAVVRSQLSTMMKMN